MNIINKVTPSIDDKIIRTIVTVDNLCLLLGGVGPNGGFGLGGVGPNGGFGFGGVGPNGGFGFGGVCVGPQFG